MSIYGNSVKELQEDTKATKRKESNKPSISVNPKKILNDKDLTTLLKNTTGFKSTAKELLHDVEGEVLGVLQKDGDVYLFSDKEFKEFTNYKGE